MASQDPVTPPSTTPERVVTVAPERLATWIAGFDDRHGTDRVQVERDAVTLRGADGAQARIVPPVAGLDPDRRDGVAALVTHVQQPRRLAALLVRRGGWAVGVFTGADLAMSKVGRGYVQGQTKAGGWSQQRYARRRGQQAAQLYAAAADAVAALLLPEVASLTALYGGGDARGVGEVLSDRRLAPLLPLLAPEVLSTVDPRLRVLQEFGSRIRAVRIELNDLA